MLKEMIERILLGKPGDEQLTQYSKDKLAVKTNKKGGFKSLSGTLGQGSKKSLNDAILALGETDED
jgi:hypothetical protein